MSSMNQSSANPPPLLLPDGCAILPIGATVHTGGVDDAPSGKIVEAIRAISEGGDQSAWLNDDGSLGDNNGLEGNAGNR